MLGKLLKYEFKATARPMLPVMLAVILFSALTRFLFSIRDSFDPDATVLLDLIIGLTTAVYVITASAAIFIVIFLICARFYNNLLKDEGYLSNTLPVSIDLHIISKLLVGFLWSVLSFKVVLLSILLVLPASREQFVNFIMLVVDEINSPVLWLTIASLILAVFSQILSYYSAIAIGQMFRHKIIAAVLVLMGFGFVFGLLMGNISIAIAMGNSNITPFQGILTMLFLPTLAQTAIHYVLTRFFMGNKLNLE